MMLNEINATHCWHTNAAVLSENKMSQTAAPAETVGGSFCLIVETTTTDAFRQDSTRGFVSSGPESGQDSQSAAPQPLTEVSGSYRDCFAAADDRLPDLHSPEARGVSLVRRWRALWRALCPSGLYLSSGRSTAPLCAVRIDVAGDKGNQSCQRHAGNILVKRCGAWSEVGGGYHQRLPRGTLTVDRAATRGTDQVFTRGSVFLGQPNASSSDRHARAARRAHSRLISDAVVTVVFPFGPGLQEGLSTPIAGSASGSVEAMYSTVDD